MYLNRLTHVGHVVATAGFVCGKMDIKRKASTCVASNSAEFYKMRRFLFYFKMTLCSLNSPVG